MSGPAWRWRPEPWWLGVGAASGAVVGAVVAFWLGVALSFDWGPGWLAAITTGGAFTALGMFHGGIVGTVVGIAPALAVGRDRPLPESRRIAAGSTAAGAAVVALVGIVLLGYDLDQPLAWTPVLVLPPLAAAQAWWWAPHLQDRPRLAEVHEVTPGR